MITRTKTSPRRTRSAAGLVPGSLPGLLAGLVLAAGLAACGTDGGDDTANDPAGSTSTPSPSDSSSDSSSDEPTSSPEPAPAAIPATGSAGVAEARLISATEGGGSASTLAFALDTDRAVSDFVLELESGLAEAVRSTVTEVARQTPGATPYGAVVSIGCEPPLSVAIDAGEAGFEVVPKLPESTVQCLAPVTYVVVFAAPDA
jgi:hypothetical protein